VHDLAAVMPPAPLPPPPDDDVPPVPPLVALQALLHFVLRHMFVDARHDEHAWVIWA
jgi:hypothetical protein